MSISVDTNQDKILYQIKRLGPLSVKSLADHLGITTMGVRQHLNQLEADGLLEMGEPQAQKRGRPVSLWKLTGQGHLRFPDAHAQVTVELIASVRDVLGEAALDKIIEDRGIATHKTYQRALGEVSGLANKVEKLAELRTAEGYMAEVEKLKEGHFLLIEQHCPICIAASRCQGFCRSELTCFQQLFVGMASVERTEYLIEGARRCSYLVKAHTPGQTG